MTSDCRDGERIERDAVKKSRGHSLIEDHSLSLCHHFEEKSPS